MPAAHLDQTAAEPMAIALAKSLSLSTEEPG